jgi:hypothetical protein
MDLTTGSSLQVGARVGVGVGSAVAALFLVCLVCYLVFQAAKRLDSDRPKTTPSLSKKAVTMAHPKNLTQKREVSYFVMPKTVLVKNLKPR